jgi:thioredoxin-dependent peroxiredoxin
MATNKKTAKKKLTTKKITAKRVATKTVTKKPSKKKSALPKKSQKIASPKTTGVTVGRTVADISLPATDGQTVRLSSLKGKHVVLYFYPRDSTPGCTIEGRDFRDRYTDFTRLNTVIFGVSRDNLKSHAKFRSEENFPFHLLADETEAACQRFDVIKPKNMYGKMVRGIERSTFLIDKTGVLRQEWRKVKIEGHADAVLAAVKAL